MGVPTPHNSVSRREPITEALQPLGQGSNLATWSQALTFLPDEECPINEASWMLQGCPNPQEGGHPVSHLWVAVETRFREQCTKLCPFQHILLTYRNLCPFKEVLPQLASCTRAPAPCNGPLRAPKHSSCAVEAVRPEVHRSLLVVGPEFQQPALLCTSAGTTRRGPSAV